MSPEQEYASGSSGKNTPACHFCFHSSVTRHEAAVEAKLIAAELVYVERMESNATNRGHWYHGHEIQIDYRVRVLDSPMLHAMSYDACRNV